MSLRVLLADESDTIKKVFQLSLQDYKPEIKSVQSGLDVVDVAQSFKPDIIFADVLLQKKNGYDVSLEIKQNSELYTIPVVLMWSSFMELDQAQYKKSLANDQLEKPFDADHLREMIKRLAPKTSQSNPISSFLQFPKTKKKLPETPTQEENSEFNNLDLEQPTALKHMGEHTQQVVLSTLNFGTTEVGDGSPMDARPKGPTSPPQAPPAKPTTPPPQSRPPVPSSPTDESWQSKDLSKFKITTENESDNLEKFEALNLSTASPGQNLQSRIASSKKLELPSLGDENIAPVQKTAPPEPTPRSPELSLPPIEETTRPAPRSPTSTTLPNDELEAIVRAHTEEFLKTHIKPSFMELIEKVVREEIAKLLEEEVRLNKDLNR